ncbi:MULTISPECIES: 7TM diverse intracellular signaling domain-containing protein [Comamonadaceae]|uniref:7TM diverse intracellular signaling domain-containing protein n=1 Tax=Acidovorax sacchari TaxID=3230736 RepID=UPI0034A5AB7D
MPWLSLPLLGLMLLCLLSPPGLARAAEPAGGSRQLAVEHLAEQEGVALAFDQVAALPGAAWVRRPPSSASYGFATAPHWFRSQPFDAGRAGGVLLLEVGYPLLDRVDMYVRTGPRAAWQHWRFGDRYPFHERPYGARNFVVPVDVQAGDMVEVIARVETQGSMRFPLTAWRWQAFEESEHGVLLVNGLYIGLMGGVFLCNFIIFLIVRDRIYLYYSGWILATSGFILSYNGLAFQYAWPGSGVWSDWCRIVFMFLAAGLFTSFTMEFVSDACDPPAWLRWSAMPVAAAAGVVAGATLLSYPQAAYLALAAQVLATLACMALAFLQARRGYAPARIFFVAFSGVLVGAALHALDMLGLTRYLESPLNFEVAPQIGSAMAVLLFSLALAHRLLEERRHQARATEMLRMNEALASDMRAAQERATALLELKDRLRLEAERRDRDKSRFLADAVHDLRQPLQAIGNALDPIGASIRSGRTEAALGLVDMATRASATMRSQLSAILDLSRLESGWVQAELSDFDLAALVRETAEQHRSVALATQVRVETVLPGPRPVFVRSDPHFLQRILTNLIGNGIKYRSASAGRQSRVALVLERAGAGGAVRLAVQDNGIGIPRDVLDSGILFRPFFQIEGRHAEAEKGVGLGLSIVSAMLGLLPGHGLSIASTVGAGSTFTLDIPPSAAAAVLEALPVPEAAAQEDIDTVSGQYVVVVEDDALVRATLAALFGAHGVLYEAWSCIDEMRDALPALERAPDVLLSDYRLPDGKTALDAVALLRGHWPDVPAIVLTGEALGPAPGIALRGVSLCYKPIAPLDLLRRIAASAAGRAAPSNFGTL